MNGYDPYYQAPNSTMEYSGRTYESAHVATGAGLSIYTGTAYVNNYTYHVHLQQPGQYSVHMDLGQEGRAAGAGRGVTAHSGGQNTTYTSTASSSTEGSSRNLTVGVAPTPALKRVANSREHGTTISKIPRNHKYGENKRH